MNTKKHLEEFYNYKHWREVQRNQLGTSANLYFVFTSAIFGFIVNFLIQNKTSIENCDIIFCMLSLLSLLISLIFYALFTENRLDDFRKTANLINDGKDYDEIIKLTKVIGKRSWNLYYKQRCSLILGFLFSIIGFLFYIF